MTLGHFPLLPISLLVAMAAFFSASETALFSLTRFQLRQLKQRNPEAFARVRHLLDRPAALVATVLLGNELANVVTSNILTSYYEAAGFRSILVTAFSLLTIMPIFLVLGEVTPKVIGAKANLVIAQALNPPFWWFYKLSFPFRFVIETTVDFLTRGLKKRSPARNEQVREEDIRDLLEDGKRKGAIHSVEQDIIENLFELDDDRVTEIATPLSECLTVHQDESPKSVIDKLSNNFHPRIPVRGDRPGEIVGILYAKDLLNYLSRDEKEMTVRDLMKEALFVESHTKIEALFRRLRQLKRHIAIVEDRSGRAVAAVTMENVLEQMFGELWEEGK